MASTSPWRFSRYRAMSAFVAGVGVVGGAGVAGTDGTGGRDFFEGVMVIVWPVPWMPTTPDLQAHIRPSNLGFSLQPRLVQRSIRMGRWNWAGGRRTSADRPVTDMKQPAAFPPPRPAVSLWRCQAVML